MRYTTTNKNFLKIINIVKVVMKQDNQLKEQDWNVTTIAYCAVPFIERIMAKIL